MSHAAPALASRSRRRFLRQLGALAALPLLSRPAWAADPAPIRPRPLRSPDSLKIVTANLRETKDEDYETGNGWTQRRELCRDILLAQHAQLFCFQECRLAQLAYFKRFFADHEWFGLANLRPGKTEEPSNAILYSTARFARTDAGGFWLSETPQVRSSRSWDTAAPRFVNWVRLRDRRADRELLVWNTHLDYHSRIARENSCLLLAQAAQKLPADLPQLLTGDMNARGTPLRTRRIIENGKTVRSEPIENPPPRSRAIQNLLDGGWIDTYAEHHGDGEPGLTAHQFRGEEFAATEQGQARTKIDYIFRRGPLVTLDAEIIRDHRAGRYPSDHYFVSAELAYRA